MSPLFALVSPAQEPYSLNFSPTSSQLAAMDIAARQQSLPEMGEAFSPATILESKHPSSVAMAQKTNTISRT